MVTTSTTINYSAYLTTCLHGVHFLLIRFMMHLLHVELQITLLIQLTVLVVFDRYLLRTILITFTHTTPSLLVLKILYHNDVLVYIHTTRWQFSRAHVIGNNRFIFTSCLDASCTDPGQVIMVLLHSALRRSLRSIIPNDWPVILTLLKILTRPTYFTITSTTLALHCALSVL